MLGRICAQAQERAAKLRSSGTDWRALAEGAPDTASFYDALRGEKVAVIAEIKRRSPSKGEINPGIDAPSQALIYVEGGAAAISVLTETANFGGSIDDLTNVSKAVKVPLLKKDFHVDPVQLYEAKALGASAALLIARALPPMQLRDMMSIARDISLETLIEVRDERELDFALAFGARIVGVNNRNLESLEIDQTTALKLIPKIPSDLIAIAESGVRTVKDVVDAAQVGADAVLVGSSISASVDQADTLEAVRAISSVPVQRDKRSLTR